jgi:hypothetical protein
LAIRVGLQLQVSVAVIHRLDPDAIRTSTPAGQPSGYDETFKEPTVFNDGTDREEARLELPPIRVPCQVEATRFEELNELFPGNVPKSSLTLVFSRIDLERLGLLDAATGRPVFGVNDRIEKIESVTGKTTIPFDDPGVFIWMIRPGSFGFGPDGYDLELAILNDREKAR